MAAKRERGEMSSSYARGIGIVLVAAVSGLLLVGFSFRVHPGIGMMGQGRGYSALACSAPTNLPGQRVDVALGDMRMMMGNVNRMMLRAYPSAVRSGQVSIVVTNMGSRTHELVVLPLAAGQSAGQRAVGSDGRINETGSLGEVSNNCGAGSGEGIESGSSGWTTLNLAPGRYELVCNLPNHYAAGMYQEFVVTAA